MPTGEYLQYGGQAIIEGVMMRSPRFFAVACRAPNSQIVLRTEAVEKTWIGRQKWLRLPFLRGSLALLDAMALGNRAMKFATGVQLAPEYQGTAEDVALAVGSIVSSNKKVQGATVALTMIVGLAFGIFIFQFSPTALAELCRKIGITNGTALNYLSELIRITFFLGLMWLLGQMPEMAEVFRYHGAEHKAINTLEAEEELTLENCRKQTRFHPRCGTSFAVIVLLVSLIFQPFVPRYPFYGHATNFLFDITVRVVLELVVLQFVAGISYELLRFAGKFRSEKLVMAAFSPGLATQRLTTKEPTDEQIEVALTALKAVVAAEKKGAAETEPEAVELTPALA